jgi:hypothetical protein
MSSSTSYHQLGRRLGAKAVTVTWRHIQPRNPVKQQADSWLTACQSFPGASQLQPSGLNLSHTKGIITCIPKDTFPHGQKPLYAPAGSTYRAA